MAEMLGGGSQVVLGTVDGLQSLSHPQDTQQSPKAKVGAEIGRPHRAGVHPVPASAFLQSLLCL